MTDGMDLATAAVEAVAQTATAAATAAGSAIGGMAVDLVRSRLSSVDQGEEAVSAVEETPDDPDARSRLREKLSQVLSEDPAFAAYLASVLAPPKPTEPRTIAGSINVDRGSRARGTFVLGNQAVTKIRRGDPWALVAIVAVVVVMAAAAYGIFLLATGDDGPPSPDAGHRVTALRDSAMVKAVVPDLHSMPSGWTVSSPASLAPGTAACKGLGVDQCEGILSVARAWFDNPYDESADFLVTAWASADDAQRFYDRVTRQVKQVSGATPVAMPAFGDQSIAIERSDGMNKSGLAYVRVGTTVVAVEQVHYVNFRLSALEALTQMVAERAQEAQDGRTPTAVAHRT
ncbi:hypothetical protein OOK39_44780 [Streptomyces sp. NBC_00264]|uniref:hypothetical protein n=2 Tax=Streptomyces TaxID=1883 RepID=UPI0022595E49|nr:MULTISPECIES: hypothetical protein [unclassified Streptomyces]MCX5166158.1 hypothetical protein [Streptomyces sp. NBC_00305]MCX5224675.1 hypothetical protein [Streptomyces sp. NBC_00264]